MGTITGKIIVGSVQERERTFLISEAAVGVGCT